MAALRYPKVSPKSLRALAIKLFNEMHGGRGVDDTRFSIRQIEAEIKHLCSVIQRDIDKQNEAEGIMPDPERVQIYACLDLEDTTDFYCSCTKSGGSFKKVRIPKMYEWKGQPYITYFGTSLDSPEKPTPFVPMKSVNALNAFAASIKVPSFFMANKSIYVALPMRYALVCQVTMMGIPEDPTETTGPCFDVWNENWAVPAYLQAMIEDRFRRSYASLMITTAQNADIINNAQHGNQILP